MKSATEIMAALSESFPAAAISWRVGATMPDKSRGQALAYIDARDVMRRLNEVMGAHWQCEYVSMANGSACCRIGLKIEGEWIWRSNGAVNLADSDKTDAREMAEKASYSDAFKRAAVLWGVGAFLYDLDAPWVQLEQKGRSQVIAPGQERVLAAALAKAAPKSRPTQSAPVAVADAEPAPRRAGPSPAVAASVARGWVSEPEAAPAPAPKPPAERPAPAKRSAPAPVPLPDDRKAAAASQRQRDGMLADLSDVYTPDHLSDWKGRYGKASGVWERMSATDRGDVLKAVKLKEAAVKPGGALAAVQVIAEHFPGAKVVS